METRRERPAACSLLPCPGLGRSLRAEAGPGRLSLARFQRAQRTARRCWGCRFRQANRRTAVSTFSFPGRSGVVVEGGCSLPRGSPRGWAGRAGRQPPRRPRRCRGNPRAGGLRPNGCLGSPGGPEGGREGRRRRGGSLICAAPRRRAGGARADKGGLHPAAGPRTQVALVAGCRCAQGRGEGSRHRPAARGGRRGSGRPPVCREGAGRQRCGPGAFRSRLPPPASSVRQAPGVRGGRPSHTTSPLPLHSGPPRRDPAAPEAAGGRPAGCAAPPPRPLFPRPAGRSQLLRGGSALRRGWSWHGGGGAVPWAAGVTGEVGECQPPGAVEK